MTDWLWPKRVVDRLRQYRYRSCESVSVSGLWKCRRAALNSRIKPPGEATSSLGSGTVGLSAARISSTRPIGVPALRCPETEWTPVLVAGLRRPWALLVRVPARSLCDRRPPPRIGIGAGAPRGERGVWVSGPKPLASRSLVANRSGRWWTSAIAPTAYVAFASCCHAT